MVHFSEVHLYILHTTFLNWLLRNLSLLFSNLNFPTNIVDSRNPGISGSQDWNPNNVQAYGCHKGR